MKYYEISEETARRAHEMMSMRDYPENRATNEYRAAVDEAAALVEKKKAAVSPFYHDKLDALLDRYARRLAEWTNAYNRNGASCPSILVSGGSNFPVRKKEKQNAREDSLWREYNEIKGILDKIKSTGTGPIDFTDPNARAMLVERLESTKALHESKKQANAYYRKHKTLDGCPGITEKDREWLTRPGVFAKGDGSPLALYGVPFPPYDLQSDNAAIKRYAARLEEYDKLQAQRDADTDTEFDGGRIVRNVEQNRLQILFDSKPDEETRAALKSNGFRWSPKNQAWQRQLTDNAECAARRALNLTDAAPAPAPEEQAEPAAPEITPEETAVNETEAKPMPETTKASFDFRGFHSVREYETECARVGYATRRVPFHKGNEKYFALVTSPPGHPTGTSIEAWTLFTADETTVVLDGIISGGSTMDPAKYMRDGVDVNYLGKLAAHGYYPGDPEEAAVKSAPAPALALEIVDDGTSFPQFSLLPMYQTTNSVAHCTMTC